MILIHKSYNVFISTSNALNKGNKLKSAIKEVALILKLIESQTKLLSDIALNKYWLSWTNKRLMLILY